MPPASRQLPAFALAVVLNGAALGFLAALSSPDAPRARQEPEPLVVELLRPEPVRTRPEPPPAKAPAAKPAPPRRAERPEPARPNPPPPPPRPVAPPPAPAAVPEAVPVTPRPAEDPRPAATSVPPAAGAATSPSPAAAVAAPVPAAPAMPTAPPPAAAPRIGPRVDASWSGNQPPPYPAQARRLGEEGEVRLDVLVGPDGAVQDVRLRRSSGSSALDRTAVETVKKWRFKPATLDGRPVAEWYEGWRWVFRLEP